MVAAAEDNSVFDDSFDKSTVAEDFDPFGIADAVSTKSKAKSTASSKNAIEVNEQEYVRLSNKSVSSQKGQALPPKLVVNFKVHEEVSSVSNIDHDSEGASDVFVQATLNAQVTCSDANQNAPFVLMGTGQSGSKMTFTPNDQFSKVYSTKDGSKINVVKIPKNIVGFVPIGQYTMRETIEHMPLLLEQKVTRTRQYIQVAVQVRSKLTNQSDLTDFSLAVSVPDAVIGRSIKIVSGDGEFDELKRTIVWTRNHLAKGESFMVSARANVEAESNLDEVEFPVLLRCSSQDQISTAQFQASEAHGHPASLSSATNIMTFRMLHRLQMQTETVDRTGIAEF